MTNILVKTECGLLLEADVNLIDDIPSESYCICSDSDCRGTEFIDKTDIDSCDYISFELEEKVNWFKINQLTISLNLIKKILFSNDKISLEIIENLIDQLELIKLNLNYGKSIEVNRQYAKFMSDLSYYVLKVNPHEFFVKLRYYLLEN